MIDFLGHRVVIEIILTLIVVPGIHIEVKLKIIHQIFEIGAHQCAGFIKISNQEKIVQKTTILQKNTVLSATTYLISNSIMNSNASNSAIMQKPLAIFADEEITHRPNVTRNF